VKMLNYISKKVNEPLFLAKNNSTYICIINENANLLNILQVLAYNWWLASPPRL
jgi:hypothetical protein